MADRFVVLVGSFLPHRRYMGILRLTNSKMYEQRLKELPTFSRAGLLFGVAVDLRTTVTLEVWALIYQ